MASGLQAFLEDLEEKDQRENIYSEPQKEELQLQLEKMFMNLRGVFNDIINHK